MSRTNCFVILLLAALLVAACQPVRPVGPRADLAASTPAQEPAVRPHQPRPDAPAYGVRGPYAVGVRDFAIDTPQRQIHVTAWYPALNPAGAEQSTTYAMDFLADPAAGFPTAGNALRDAAPDPAGGPYPLVVYSHGAWCFPAIGSFLTEHLASYGFIVMAPVHEDNWGTLFAPTYNSEISRPRDIARVLDLAEELAAPGEEWDGVIDMEKVAVTGQSFGGQIALEMGGARLNLEEWQANYCVQFPDDDDCKTYPDQIENLAAMAGLDAVPQGLWPDWSDPRIDVVVATAPGVSKLGGGGLSSMHKPIMLLMGTSDSFVGPEHLYRQAFENLASSNKTRVLFENADHMIFGNACPAYPGMVDAGFYFVCSDSVWDMDRAHDLINHFVTAFLLAELKGDAAAATALAPENVSFPGVKYEAAGYTAAAPESTLDAATTAKIDAIVKDIMAGGQVPGAAAGIVKDGKLVYAKGFGNSQLGGGAPVSLDSVFSQASIAKSAVGMAVMQLVQDGKIELDAPVTTYLPYFQMKDAQYQDITIAQLLSHTSGMPDLTAADAEWRPRSDDGALEAYVRSMATETLLSAPGEAWSYSNTGFDILGDVIAKVSGRSFEDYMHEHVLEPLGMEHSSYSLGTVDPGLLATPYMLSADGKPEPVDPFPYSRNHAPSGYLLSGVSDMARFAAANMNRGELDGTRVLPAAAYDEMWAPQSPTPWAAMFGPQVTNYGFGWFVGEYEGHRVVGNYGVETGFQSHLSIFPDDGLAVVAMVNLCDPENGPFYAYDIGNGIAKLLLNAE